MGRAGNKKKQSHVTDMYTPFHESAFFDAKNRPCFYACDLSRIPPTDDRSIFAATNTVDVCALRDTLAELQTVVKGHEVALANTVRREEFVQYTGSANGSRDVNNALLQLPAEESREIHNAQSRPGADSATRAANVSGHQPPQDYASVAAGGLSRHRPAPASIPSASSSRHVQARHAQARPAQAQSAGTVDRAHVSTRTSTPARMNSDAPDGENQWKTVDRRKRKYNGQRKVAFGTRSGGGLRVLEYNRSMPCRIFVSRLAADTTAAEIVSYLQTVNIMTKSVIANPDRKNESYASFIVETDDAYRDSITDPSVWARGVLVRPYWSHSGGHQNGSK